MKLIDQFRNFTHIHIHIHSQILYLHKLDWMLNSLWKELNSNMQSSQIT